MAEGSKDITLIVSRTTRQIFSGQEKRGREKIRAAPEAPGKFIPSPFSTENYNGTSRPKEYGFHCTKGRNICQLKNTMFHEAKIAVALLKCGDKRVQEFLKGGTQIQRHGKHSFIDMQL